MPFVSIAILTIIDSAPAQGSFRPEYTGTQKSVKFNIDQLDYSKLQRLPITFQIQDSFYPDNSGSLEVIITPEPATLALLSLGGLVLRKKCRA